MKIVWLIVLVSAILIANTLFNNKIITDNNNIYSNKNSIYQSLEYLDELKYLTVKIDYAQNEYVAQNNYALKDSIVNMRHREWDLIEKLSSLLRTGALQKINFIAELSILHENKAELNDPNTVIELLNLKMRQKHEPLIQSTAIRSIEEKLYGLRVKLMANSQKNLRIIYYTDLTQTILIILITIGIVRLMLSENKRQIQLVKELKQLNATKDKFFSIISHDLRNPFQAILGFSDMLINNFDKYPKEQMLEFIGLINQSSKKAFELLENLLEWSNLQTKKMKPVFQSVSSYEIINEVTQLLSGMAEQKHISLIFDSTIDEKILTDRNMINTILRNLISNAIKFTGINGKIEIKTQSNSHTVAISIADNGMGMDKDDIEKLFKIETKISTTGTQGEKGTGLGLLLCKDLVELNHGSIEAVSEIGSGSTFTIRIPKYVEIE